MTNDNLSAIRNLMDERTPIAVQTQLVDGRLTVRSAVHLAFMRTVCTAGQTQAEMSPKNLRVFWLNSPSANQIIETVHSLC